MSATLLIDISNSAVKVTSTDGITLGAKRTHPTAEFNSTWLAGLAGETAATRAVVSSVVPEKTAVARDVFGDSLLEVSPDIELGIAIDYPEPATIGPDRLANAAAFAAIHECPGVVVDFGTAVTFDILAENSTYVGGVIAPGLAAMTDYLYQRTALLPRIDLSEPLHVVGKSTREAMLAGAVVGYRGMVKEIIAEVRAEVGASSFPVIATGGYAELIAARVPEINSVDPDLTLEGLRIIAKLNG